MDLAGSATEREREWIAGSYYFLTKRYDQALGQFEALLHRYPDDSWALHNLITLYATQGRRGDLLDAVAREADAQPKNFIIQAQTAAAFLGFDGLVAARPRVARARQLMPGPSDKQNGNITRASIWTLLFPAHELWAEGRAADAARVLDGLSDRPDFVIERYWTLHMLGTMRLALGQLRLADEAFSRISDPKLRGLGLSMVALARGDTARIAEQLKEKPLSDLVVVSLLIRARKLDAAARFLAKVSALPEVERPNLATWAANEIEEARRNRERIALALKAGVPWTNVMPAGARTFMYSETLARAAAAIGNRPAAIRVLEDTSPLGSRAYGFFTESGFHWMRNQKLMADLYRQDGQVEKARAIERDLLARLAVADPDYPLLVELKQRVRQ
jgi:tetratricopeptide (TPR) repeat protein